MRPWAGVPNCAAASLRIQSPPSGAGFVSPTPGKAPQRSMRSARCLDAGITRSGLGGIGSCRISSAISRPLRAGRSRSNCVFETNTCWFETCRRHCRDDHPWRAAGRAVDNGLCLVRKLGTEIVEIHEEPRRLGVRRSRYLRTRRSGDGKAGNKDIEDTVCRTRRSSDRPLHCEY